MKWLIPMVLMPATCLAANCFDLDPSAANLAKLFSRQMDPYKLMVIYDASIPKLEISNQPQIRRDIEAEKEMTEWMQKLGMVRDLFNVTENLLFHAELLSTGRVPNVLMLTDFKVPVLGLFPDQNSKTELGKFASRLFKYDVLVGYMDNRSGGDYDPERQIIWMDQASIKNLKPSDWLLKIEEWLKFSASQSDRQWVVDRKVWIKALLKDFPSMAEIAEQKITEMVGFANRRQKEVGFWITFTGDGNRYISDLIQSSEKELKESDIIASMKVIRAELRGNIPAAYFIRSGGPKRSDDKLAKTLMRKADMPIENPNIYEIVSVPNQKGDHHVFVTNNDSNRSMMYSIFRERQK